MIPANIPTADIRRVEELSLNAWPSLKQVLHDGWVLRFAGGYTRRSNSVNPLYPGSADLGQKIRFCQTVYRAAGLPTVFKLTAAAQPAGLAEALTTAGFHAQAPTSVQTLDLGNAADVRASAACGSATTASESESSTSSEALSEEWLSAFTRFTPVVAEKQPVLRAILTAIAPRKCFTVLTEGGEIAACGLGVLQDGWIGLFDIVTRADARRRGFGRRVVNALLDWGRANGAARAYLQVMHENDPARALYAGIGFREAYQYIYFVD